MKTLASIGLALAAIALVCWVWLYRFYTNTASGRFYKNDRWTWKTLVVEKDGLVHWLLPPKEKEQGDK